MESGSDPAQRLMVYSFSRQAATPLPALEKHSTFGLAVAPNDSAVVYSNIEIEIPPEVISESLFIRYLLVRRRRQASIPSNPPPSSPIVPGSGTAATPPPT